MAADTNPPLVTWLSCAITGSLLAWLGTGIVILFILASLFRSDTEVMAELTGQRDPHQPGKMLTKDNLGYAFVPFYFLGMQKPNLENNAPPWEVKNFESDKTNTLYLHLLRFGAVALAGYLFANWCCGKQRLVQIIVRGMK